MGRLGVPYSGRLIWAQTYGQLISHRSVLETTGFVGAQLDVGLAVCFPVLYLRINQS